MKPTWSKVYSGPGYPVDPKKQSERGYFVTAKNEVLLIGVDLAHTPDGSMFYFFESVTKGIMAGFEPLPPKPKCNCPACVFDATEPTDEEWESFWKHKRREMVLETEDFQSRLMEIQVKERQSG